MRYDLLEHTADIMVRTTGANMAECFANAAYALQDQIVDVEKVRPIEHVVIEADGFDLEATLLNFLSEFLFLLDTRRLVFSKFEVKITGLKLVCNAWGEIIDPERHGAKREVKAITYHMMDVDESIPSVTVIFDI